MTEQVRCRIPFFRGAVRSCSVLLISLFVAHGNQVEESIVCVTGATGYLASEVVSKLLERGTHTVRGTVRSLKDENKLKALRGMPGASRRLQLLEADLLDPEAFNSCVNGAEVVFHTASPFVTSGITDPVRELVEPAVNGTLSVLKAAARSGTVKHIVLTSSVAAVMGGLSDKDSCFDEDDWNESSTLDGDGLSQYRFSKVMAERAAWEYVAFEAPELELSTVLPSFIVGPPRTSRVDSESLANMAAVLRGEAPLRGATPMADVRDVADVHLRAAFGPRPAPSSKRVPSDVYDVNRRYIVSSPHSVTPKEVLRAVAARLPHMAIARVEEEETDDALSHPEKRRVFCSKTLPKLLGSGVELTSPQQSLGDMAAAMVELGNTVPAIRNAEL